LSQTAPPSRTRSILLALFVVFLWATSWVLVKIGLEQIPALTFAGLRYALAFLCLLLLTLATRRRISPRPLSRAAVGQLLALGLLLYTATQGAMFLALAYLPTVTVNLLWNFTSVAVALLGIVALSEHPSRFQWLGVLIASLGAVIYFSPAGMSHVNPAGLAVSILGLLTNAGAVILARNVNRSGEIHPILVTVVSMGFGSLTLLLIGLLSQGLPPISVTGWAIIAWLAIVNTAFAFTLWNYTLRTLSATESSIINGTMLIWIPVLAVIFLGETIRTIELLGLITAAVGTLFVQLRSPSAISGMFHRGAHH
jgi:drug/metabolite transporter (DMT)-like permease